MIERFSKYILLGLLGLAGLAALVYLLFFGYILIWMYWPILGGLLAFLILLSQGQWATALVILLISIIGNLFWANAGPGDAPASLRDLRDKIARWRLR